MENYFYHNDAKNKSEGSEEDFRLKKYEKRKFLIFPFFTTS